MFHAPGNKAEAMYLASRQNSLDWFNCLEVSKRSTPDHSHYLHPLIQWIRWLKTSLQQECIPVGCLPPASMVISTGGSVYPGDWCVHGVCVHGGCTPWTQRQTIPPDPEADIPPPYCMLGYTPLPWTEACENITLPQTSFAGGNNSSSLSTFSLRSDRKNYRTGKRFCPNKQVNYTWRESVPRIDITTVFISWSTAT